MLKNAFNKLKTGFSKGDQPAAPKGDQAPVPTGDQPAPVGDQPAAPTGKQPTTSAAAPEQPAAPSKPQSVGIMDAFSYAYVVFGYFAALLVVMVFILSTLDVLKYSTLEVVQYTSLFLNPNKFNKDTLDVATLAYYKNNREEEPYTIYLQQDLVSLMFKVGTYFVMLVALQIFLFLVISIISKISGNPYTENLNLTGNSKVMITVIIAVCCAFIMNLLYNSSFLNGLQPVLKGANDYLENIKNYMYDNVTTNDAFLKAMITGDIGECMKIMNQQSNNNSVARMIFTLSLYNFFKINISESDEVFITTIQKIFTPLELSTRSINPIHFMYYNQNVFLPNLYPIVRRYIYGENKAIQTPENDRKLREEVTMRINELNKRLMYLFKLPQKRDSFRNYLFYSWLAISIFIVGIYAIYKKEFNVIYNDFIVPYIGLVWMMFVGTAPPIKSKEEGTEKDEKEEAKKKAEEEAEAKKKAEEEAEAKKKAEEEAKNKAEEEAEAKKKAEEEAKNKAEEEAKKKEKEAFGGYRRKIRRL